jgi:outer membrane receptor for monomeric catechols
VASRPDRLPPDDVQEAIRYSEQHRDEVMTDYEAILNRHREHQYTPEVKEKLRRSREKFQARLAQSNGTRTQAEAKHAGDHGGS